LLHATHSSLSSTIYEQHDNDTYDLSFQSFIVHIPLVYFNTSVANTMTQAKLPLIPLPKGTVLLPGIVLRIGVSASRPDIPAILSHVYSQAASKPHSQRLDSVHIACVPLNSPLLSQHGQKMITGNDPVPKHGNQEEAEPSSISKTDLFGYGVAAKITGVEGRGTGEFALIVEGVARIRIDRFVQEKPFFEAEVIYEHDEGMDIEHVSIHRLIAPSDFCRRRCFAGPVCPTKAIISRTINPSATFFLTP
jgi:hypothetical protein